MDYLTLIHGTDRIERGRFLLAALPEGGQDMRCFGTENYAMIFCLQGSVEFEMRAELERQWFTLGKQNLVVVDRNRIRHCYCCPGTVVLKYALFGLLAEYAASCSQAFHKAALSVVPILPELNLWLDDLIAKMLRDTDGASEDYSATCCQLAEMLLKYPRSLLQEIYMPLFACHRKCRRSGRCVFPELNSK